MSSRKGGRGKSPVRATVAMSPGGKSKPTQNQQTSRKNKGDNFLQHVAVTAPELTARWGQVWANVAEAELASREIWQHFADYLSNVYVIPEGNVHAGQHLALKPAHQDWTGLIDITRKALEKTGSSESKVSCRCARALHTDKARNFLWTVSVCAHAKPDICACVFFARRCSSLT